MSIYERISCIALFNCVSYDSKSKVLMYFKKMLSIK